VTDRKWFSVFRLKGKQDVQCSSKHSFNMSRFYLLSYLLNYAFRRLLNTHLFYTVLKHLAYYNNIQFISMWQP